MSTNKSPLIKAADIQSSLREMKHPYDAECVSQTSRLADMAGLQGTGLNYYSLPPNTQSCPVHHHLISPEWVYVLSGSGHLLLSDATLASGSFSDPPPAPQPSEIKVEEHPIATGDFMGFKAGQEGSETAHALRAGSEGLVYLAGGPRTGLIDLCAYPTLGKTVMYDMTGQIPAFTSPPYHEAKKV